jgi:hypothetical protein
MNQIAVEFGSLLCRGAVQIGFGGLRCYEQTALQGFGWSGFAAGVIVAVLVTKWLGKSRAA